MNILILSNKSPLPPNEGGPMAIYNLSYALIQQHRLKILTICTPKFPVRSDITHEFYKNATSLEYVFVDTRITLKGAFLNLFSNKSYHISRFQSKIFEDKLINLLRDQKFEIIQLESLYMTPYISTIRKYSNARIILRTHNIEHLIWERITSNTTNFFKRFYLNLLTNKLKKYEIASFKQVDGIAAITPEDAAIIKKYSPKTPSVVIPFGIDVTKYPMQNIVKTTPSLFHIGSMDWIPNQEGINWFLLHCWPLINSSHPELKVHLAGRNMPWWLFSKEINNVVIEGEVADAKQFMYQHSIQVVPLLSGSGIRIKIIEAMALGKPVIATTIAAEGINYTDGKNILIANTPEDFNKQIHKLISKPDLIANIGLEAQLLIKNEYAINKIVDNLTSFYNSCLNS